MTYDKKYYEQNKEKAKAASRRYYEEHRKERIERIRQYQKEHKDEINAYVRKRRQEDPNTTIRARAHEKVANAKIYHGLKMHQPCEVCGDKNGFAHHDDYTKPLEVRFLCQKCHTEWHKNNTPIYK